MPSWIRTAGAFAVRAVLAYVLVLGVGALADLISNDDPVGAGITFLFVVPIVGGLLGLVDGALQRLHLPYVVWGVAALAAALADHVRRTVAEAGGFDASSVLDGAVSSTLFVAVPLYAGIAVGYAVATAMRQPSSARAQAAIDAASRNAQH